MVRIQFDAYGMQRVPSAMRYVTLMRRHDDSLWIVDYGTSRMELQQRVRMTRISGSTMAVLTVEEADRLMVYLQQVSDEAWSAVVDRMIGELPQTQIARSKPKEMPRTPPTYRGAVLPVAGWEEEYYE